MANGERGQVTLIVLTIRYPDGTTKTVQLQPTDVSKIVLNPIANDPVPTGWRTDDWRANPSYMVVKNDGSVALACSVQSHPPAR